ncbi:hypothetical protein [Dyella telluris]|uniref:Uncharacterized protein n=1 Tax=Dyella telluris TaxID=2763498 RepID=A0A7G8Q3J3_9GAMM|nr:hypothetical protein [Dyella telluris]QNK01351.1 hypothetical protein H8F01_20300 [Dyella telluris]
MQKLLDIGYAIEIPGQGAVLVGRTEQTDAVLCKGDVFDLILTTGERRTLTALGVSPFTKCFTEATTLGVLVGDQLDTLDAVDGSELWINWPPGQ